MNHLPALTPQRLHILFYTASAVHGMLLELAASLALRGPLLVLDGGNHFNGYVISKAIRREGAAVMPVLQRIQVARAFTCYQMAAMLNDLPVSTTPLLALDLLSTFQDESVPLYDRKRLLAGCLPELQRLSRAAPVLVSARPGEPELAELLAKSADEIWHIQQPITPPALKLF
jgi:hypothetical protein